MRSPRTIAAALAVSMAALLTGCQEEPQPTPGPLLPVVFASLETPDLFKDGAEVVVEGQFRAADAGTFHADKVMAKCPSKFEGMDPAQAAALN